MGRTLLILALGMAALARCATIGSCAAPHDRPVRSATQAGESGRADEAAAAEVHRLRDMGRLAAALEATQAIEDPGVRARLSAELHWTAGDLAGALEVARAGLDRAPDDVLLLRLVVDLGLALRAVEGARAHFDHLRAQIEERTFSDEKAFSGVEREWWAGQLEGLEEALSSEERALTERERALARAKWVTIGAGLGALLALLFLLRRNAGLEGAAPRATGPILARGR